MSLDEDMYSMDHGDRVDGGGVVECVVGLAIVVPVIVAIGAADGARAVKEKLGRARAALKVWPVPTTLGVLTNDDIDRLPARPGRS